MSKSAVPTDPQGSLPLGQRSIERRLYGLFGIGMAVALTAGMLAANVVNSVQRHSESADHSRATLTRLATVLTDLSAMERGWCGVSLHDTAANRSEFVVGQRHLLGSIAALEPLLPTDSSAQTKLRRIGDLIGTHAASHDTIRTPIDKNLVQEVRTLAESVEDAESEALQRADMAEQESFAQLYAWAWIGGGCGSLLFVGFMVLTWRDFKLQREANAKLETLVKQRTAELSKAHDKLQRLSAYVERAREEERLRIARDIHDDLGSTLTALKMELSGQPALVDASPTRPVRRQRASVALVDSAMRSVQNVVTELRPIVLDRFGLWEALKARIRQFEQSAGIRCGWSVPPYLVQPGKDIATCVYRIVDEALTNVARHAQATRVNLVVHQNTGGLSIVIADNGSGIAQEHLASAQAFGLLGMQERARLCGGLLSINGVRNRGTTISLVLPKVQLNVS